MTYRNRIHIKWLVGNFFFINDSNFKKMSSDKLCLLLNLPTVSIYHILKHLGTYDLIFFGKQCSQLVIDILSKRLIERHVLQSNGWYIPERMHIKCVKCNQPFNFDLNNNILVKCTTHQQCLYHFACYDPHPNTCFCGNEFEILQFFRWV